MSAAEHARIRNAERQLASANKAEVRALAKSWGVPQKVAGDNRSVPDMRRDIKEKIKEAARRAGIALALAELGAMAQGEPVAGIAPALTEPGACVPSSGHAPTYAETEVELMQSTMLVPWDDIESPVRVMLNNGIDVNRVGVWQLYAELAVGVMVVCFVRWRAHLGAGEHELC